MDDDIQTIKKQIIAVVVEREGDLLSVRDKIQAIVDGTAQEFAAQSVALEKKYIADPNATTADFKREYQLLGEKIKCEAQKNIDDLLRSIEQA